MQTETRTGGRASVVRALDVVATMLLIVASCVVVWRNVLMDADRGQPKEPEVPAAPISLSGLEMLGDPMAPVAIVEFSDFQCPFCRRFASETLPYLTETFVKDGKVQIGFRHKPLTTIHPQAQRMAEATECAADQGKFWPFHDELFRAEGDVSDLAPVARRAGLNSRAFAECLSTTRGTRVREDAKLADALGVSGTPTFFIGNVVPGGAVAVSQVITGVRTREVFTEAINRLLRQ